MDVGGEIRLGSMLFTLVEPHRGHEVEYNRWYERDHFYAGCMVGPWLYSGRRWVATRDLKALRFPEPPLFGDDPAAGSYLAVYYVIDGKHDEHFGWGLKQVRWLHDNDRMFAEREHVHTLLYDFVGAGVGDDGVPAELSLDHPYAGLIATVVDLARGDSATALATWPAAGDGNLQLVFTPIPLRTDAPVSQRDVGGLEARAMVLTFLRHHPAAAWDAHRTAAVDLEANGTGRVAWTSGFIPTVPGTDTYTDELW